MSNKVRIRMLATGVPGLDTVLGGGLPELSFNLVAGGPGCGKTTLAHQFVFANATETRKALYFTIFGEPAIKMLRYQQQFEFFEASKVGAAIRFVHLGKEMIEGGLDQVMERITQAIDATDARIVVVDSFRSVARTVTAQGAMAERMDLERFVQLLALALTTCEATTFLIGEYSEQETNSNPIFTVADGILWLSQTVVHNSAVRQVQAMKMRGAAPVPGLHTMKLTDNGLRVYPRLSNPEERPVVGGPRQKKKTGIPGLDAMLGGGIPEGYSMLVVGPSGSGKSMLATQFILEGVGAGETAVLAIFEKRPDEYLRTVPAGRELERLIADDKMKLVYIRPLDLSVDETLEELQEAITRLDAKRVVIDSLSGFELALASPFREEFRESLYRMVGALTNLGVTLVLTAELTESFTELRLSAHGTSFLTDGIILQRDVEIDGSLRKVMTVVKMRASDHAKEFREYDITSGGLVVGDVLRGHPGILTGAPMTTKQARTGKKQAGPALRRGRTKPKRRAR